MGRRGQLHDSSSPSPASVLLTASLAAPLPATDTVYIPSGDTAKVGGGCWKDIKESQWPGTNIKVKGLDFC